MIDVYLTALLSDWLTRQEENSSCKFGALQVIKVGRAGVYYKTGNEKRPTFRKSRVYQPCQPIFSYLRAVPICFQIFWVGDGHFAFPVHLITCRFLCSKNAHMRP